jgi:hypothetical protein
MRARVVRLTRRKHFRLGLLATSIAVVAVVALGGSLMRQRQPEAAAAPAKSTASPATQAPSSPSATPASTYPVWSLQSPQLPPQTTPRPTWSPVPPASTSLLTVLELTMQDEEVLWAPDGRHFAIPSTDAGVSNVHIFDSSGIWVGEAPGSRASWASDDTLLVLPLDSTTSDGLLTAYIASFGYNDVSTMEALPGRYSDIIGSGEGAAALPTAHGYAVWRNGSLQPEVKCDCGPVAISADGSLVAIEDSTGLMVVRTGNGQNVQSWPGLQTGAHLHASFSPDGRHVALNSVYGSLNTLVALNVSDGRRADLLAGHFVYNGAWVDNDRLFAGDDSGGWWLLPADGSRPKTAGLPMGSWAAVTSSTGSIAALDSSGTKLSVATSGKNRTLALPSPALGLHWSPDGLELVAGCESGAVILVRP